MTLMTHNLQRRGRTVRAQKQRFNAKQLHEPLCAQLLSAPRLSHENHYTPSRGGHNFTRALALSAVVIYLSWASIHTQSKKKPENLKKQPKEIKQSTIQLNKNITTIQYITIQYNTIQYKATKQTEHNKTKQRNKERKKETNKQNQTNKPTNQTNLTNQTKLN